jgi:hypothetical protein
MFRKCTILFGLTVMASLVMGTAIRSEEEDDSPGKGKGKGAAPAGKVIQIDLDKLPPDLAKALKKYAGGDKGKAAPAPAAKGKPAPAAQAPRMEGFGKFVEAQVARGLRGTALAAAIHKEQARRGVPGQLGAKAAAPPARGKSQPAAKPGKGKGKGSSEDDD